MKLIDILELIAVFFVCFVSTSFIYQILFAKTPIKQINMPKLVVCFIFQIICSTYKLQFTEILIVIAILLSYVLSYVFCYYYFVSPKRKILSLTKKLKKNFHNYTKMGTEFYHKTRILFKT
jgi:hypothetical protein